MYQTIAYPPALSPVENKHPRARFDGGRLSSDGGVLLPRGYFLRISFSTNTLSALDKLPVRLRSISVTNALNVTRRAAAICFRARQNSGSSDTEVRWPSMATEYLPIDWAMLVHKPLAGASALLVWSLGRRAGASAPLATSY